MRYPSIAMMAVGSVSGLHRADILFSAVLFQGKERTSREVKTRVGSSTHHGRKIFNSRFLMPL
jgi:hypothetical protein